MKPLPILKWVRSSQSLSQRDLAEKSRVSQDTIGQLERGERQARPATVRKLADALDVPVELLSARNEDEFRSRLTELGYSLGERQIEWESKSHAEVLLDLTLASEKIDSGQLAEMTEAALIMTRASAQLIAELAERLDDYYYRTDPSFPHIAKLGRSLVDAWLEGAAATKGFVDMQDKVSHRWGFLSLTEVETQASSKEAPTQEPD